MGIAAEDLLLEVALEARHDRDHGDQRHDAEEDSADRDDRDQREEAALSPRGQVAARDVPLQLLHGRPFIPVSSWGRG